MTQSADAGAGADLALLESFGTRARETRRIARAVFGRSAWPLVAGMRLLGIAVRFGQALDGLLLGRVRRGRVERPIVIVGNPRSGTTFLHRWLDRQGVGAGVPLWRLLFPVATLGLLVRPFLPLLERVSPARHHASAAHKTSLVSPETDDAGLFFRFHDGFFLYGFFWAWAEDERRSWFDPRVRDTSARDFDWLERIWVRHAWATGARPIGKLFSVAVRTPAFLERFPDARVLYMVRDPVSVIPSCMSLVTGVLDKRFGIWKLPEPVRARYLERLYQALVDLYLVFHEDWTAGRVDRERVHIVRFDRMMRDFEGVMDEVLAFLGVEADEALAAAIRETGEKQRAYKSRHAYDLARFGLTEERIRRDLAPIYETFLAPLEG